MKRSAALLLAGGLVDETGFRIGQVALPLIALTATGSTASVGLVAGLAGVPVLLAPWWARRIRQRLTTSRQLALLHLLEALVMSGLALGVWLDSVSVVLLGAVGFGRGVMAALVMPARSSILADLGDRFRERGAARLLAWDDAQTRVALVAGPPIGVVLWSAGAVPASCGVVLACMIAAALSWFAGVRTEPSTAHAPSIRAALAGSREIVAGWWIRGTGCLCWFAFSLGLPVLSADDGGLLAAVGFTAYGCGGVVAALVATRLVDRVRPLVWAAFGWTVCGAAFAAMAVWPTVPVVVSSALAAGLTTPLGNACISALVVRATVGPDRRAALAGQRTLVTAASTLGTLAGAPMFAAIGTRETMIGAGALVAFTPPLVMTAVRRSATRREPTAVS